MNILFVVADFPNVGQANINIAYNIKRYFESKGYNIYIYGKYLNTNCENVIPLDTISKLFCHIQISNVFFFKCLRKVYNYLFHFLKMQDIYELVYNRMTKRIIKSIKGKNIQSIIVFSAPHELNNILRQNINIPIYMYMLDPYFSHYKYSNKKKELEFEEEILMKNVTKSFVTFPIYVDYCNSKILSNYLDKLIVVDFPKIDNEKYCKSSSNTDCIISFFGNLYKDIRHPKKIIEIFSNINCVTELNFYGNNYGFTKSELGMLMFKYPFVHFNSPITFSEVKQKINESHFLLNIGNSIPNQMPSKIIEYINTGKPIINCIKINKCPTLRYTNKYPLAINVLEEKPNFDELEEFIKVNKDKILSKEYILHEYNYCTLDYIGNKILSTLKEGDKNGKI